MAFQVTGWTRPSSAWKHSLTIADEAALPPDSIRLPQPGWQQVAITGSPRCLRPPLGFPISIPVCVSGIGQRFSNATQADSVLSKWRRDDRSNCSASKIEKCVEVAESLITAGIRTELRPTLHIISVSRKCKNILDLHVVVSFKAILPIFATEPNILNRKHWWR